MRIREIDPKSSDEIRVVATRMRQTLVEVLGEEVGGNMYTMEWLVDRVQFHLDPARSTAKVFLAIDDEEIVGHTIVRLEPDEQEGRIGLFSTTYVIPEARRQGTAALLLQTGESWLCEQGMKVAVTYTDVANTPLQQLYKDHGYEVSPMPNDFVALRKSLLGSRCVNSPAAGAE